MRLFKHRSFCRFAAAENLSDDVLRQAMLETEAGLVDADLGSGLIKKRVAAAGRGKSGGYRILLFFKRGDRAMAVYGFAKSMKDNISKDEMLQWKKLAKIFLALPDNQIEQQIANGLIMELENHVTDL